MERVTTMIRPVMVYQHKDHRHNLGWTPWAWYWELDLNDWEQYNFKVDGVQQTSFEELQKMYTQVKVWEQLQK